MSFRSILKADPTEWLLSPDDPSVRFWALKDLENSESTDPVVEKAQDEVMESPLVRAILDAQAAEGHWVSPENMYLPKYRASTHSLLILAELGARETHAIERGLEHIFTFQRDSGHFLSHMPKTRKGRASTVKDGCCLDGNILYYMIHFDYLNDPRVKKTLDFTVDYHSIQDAGWKCRAYPINPEGVFPSNCFMGAVKVLKAFANIPKNQRSDPVRSIIKREVENILENEVFKYLKFPDGSRKEKAGWKRFGFPLFYQSDAMEVLDVLTRLEVRDRRMQNAVDLVLNVQEVDGRWLLRNTFNGKMWVDIEAKGEPSKWITLRAMRVLKRYYLI